MDDLLFCTKDLGALIREYPRILDREIEALDDGLLLRSDEDDVVDMLVRKFELVVPTLRPRDEWTQSTHDTKLDVSHDPTRAFFARPGAGPLLVAAHEVAIDIPFDGDGDLFEFQPSTYSSRTPRGRVSKTTSTLSFSIVQEQLDADAILQELDSEVANISKYLQWMRGDCERWNLNLRDTISSSIRVRKDRLLQQDKLGDVLGIRNKEGGGKHGEQTYTVPSIRKPKPRVLTVSKGSREPTLSIDDYDYILDVVSSLGRDMEKTPGTYAKMDEEHVRDHILSTLATHVKGGATRETFNKEGKTDILIQVEGMNIFVAECKIWSGVKALQKAIDQTLGYLTWRDTKAALIVFSRNRDFTNVQASLYNSVPHHPNYKRTDQRETESQARYTFRHKDDPEREIRLAVLVFNFHAG